ncbi:hypothetical protein EPO44_21880 [bacterium]|nr:MAG: hypothetical protein EPO44_21880 [bacterium]
MAGDGRPAPPVTTQRKERVRQRITVAVAALSLYALSRKTPKEIAKEIGKSVKWVRRLIKKFH